MALIKIIDDKTKKCEVALNENPDEKAVAYFKSIGFVEGDFEVGYDGIPYLKGFAPEKPKTLMEQEVRATRNSYLEKYVDPKQLVLVWNSLTEDEQKEYTDYRKYLLDYPETESWYEQPPKTFEEWKQGSELEQIIASGD